MNLDKPDIKKPIFISEEIFLARCKISWECGDNPQTLSPRILNLVVSLLYTQLTLLIQSWIFKCVAVAVATNLIAIFKSNWLRVVTSIYVIFKSQPRKHFKHLKIHVLLAALAVVTATETATTTATAMATHLKIQL